ncbi:MAG: molybdopterin-binding protein [Betaproteobacteria bacterium]|jgi:molybdopterin-biosynthesis enzyme MoeA-like protein
MNSHSQLTPPSIGIIIIGDEILSGKRSDKHLPKFIELLNERGLQLAWAEYVGDSPERITQVLARAFASGDVVFSCGGIGATPDDHTRQCAAQALGLPLVLQEQAKALILERMRDVALEQGVAFEPDRNDNVHRLNMGTFPQGAQIIHNPYNKIPGFTCQGVQQGMVHFVPGFPVMAWPMMQDKLDAYCQTWGAAPKRIEKSVIVFGAMEATLTPLMERIELQHAGIKVFSLPSVDHPKWGKHIELGVKGAEDQIETAFQALKDGLKPFSVELGPEMVR